MFDTVPRAYRLLNTVLTLGLDDVWRAHLIRKLQKDTPRQLLDICTGTGDLALRLARRFPEARVFAVDFSEEMLREARRRAESAGAGQGGDAGARTLEFCRQDCTHLGFQDGFFDAVCVSFGFRNLSFSLENAEAALAEVHRVLKRSGRFLILETSQPRHLFWRRAFHFYALHVVPLVGRLLSGRGEPYRYLGQSITRFFDVQALHELLARAGFTLEDERSFLFGAVRLSVFQKKP